MFENEEKFNGVMYKKISENVKCERELKDLTQIQLCNISGVSLTTLRRIEQNNFKDLKLSILLKICFALKINLAELEN